ncbi:ABC transporter [Loktanella fryxellensis]|uniref:ABC transporter n=1 Tax=Loktanella fryxellensis TaxID=245187 RepID=A0A1H8DJJ5_9RHOB|nr:ABC transporter [Loktanella fryxellensis]
MVQRAWRARDSLAALLAAEPVARPKVSLPRPSALLDIRQISVVPPQSKAPTLRRVSFDLRPGEAVGVIGSSGSGKSTLARALTGVWPLASGKICWMAHRWISTTRNGWRI